MRSMIMMAAVLAFGMFAGNRLASADEESYRDHMNWAFDELRDGNYAGYFAERQQALSELDGPAWPAPRVGYYRSAEPNYYYRRESYYSYPAYRSPKVYYYRSQYSW